MDVHTKLPQRHSYKEQSCSVQTNNQRVDKIVQCKPGIRPRRRGRPRES
jgi:hypothetical protein